MFDGEAFGAQMVEIVKGYVDKAVAPLIERNDALEAANTALIERIAALEARELPEAIKGDPGEVDMDAVRLLIAEEVKTIPPAEPGAPGKPGEVDMEAVAALIDKAVTAIPVPERGKDCDMADVERIIAEKVAAIPAAKDGVGLARAFKDHEGSLILTMTNGETCNLGRIDGKDGKDGKTFTPDDFDIDMKPDGRTLEMKFINGDTAHVFELCFPVPVYRDVWREDGTYERGDCVTWAGSLWHAQKDNPGKPDAADGGWKLAVKKGRDGKSLKGTE